MPDAVVQLSDLIDDGTLEIGAGRPRTAGVDLPVLRVADVLDGRIQPSVNAADVAGHGREAYGPKVSKPGDIVLTTKGTVGRVAVMPVDGPAFAYSPQICYFRPGTRGRLEFRYLYYWFRGPEFVGQIAPLKSQTDMADFVSLQDLLSLKLHLPPIARQRAIADVLGALDDKIAANDRSADLARQLARELYDRGVTGAPTATMSTRLTPLLGGTPSRKDESLWDGTIPWASAKDVTGAPHGLVVTTTERISENATRTGRLKPAPKGSVVLTARGTVGAVARLGIAATINQSCYSFVPGEIPAACLLFMIEDASAQAKGMAHGSVFDTITMRTFDHVQTPALPREEWLRLESQLAPLWELIEKLVLESGRLATTRDELLPLLMSGKIRVKDAEKSVEELL